MLKRMCLNSFRTSLVYRSGGHLDHVTWTIYINFHSPYLRRLHLKISIEVVSGKMFENDSHIHVQSPGAGADNPTEVNFFH